jgi:hypothetical protein
MDKSSHFISLEQLEFKNTYCNNREGIHQSYWLSFLNCSYQMDLEIPPADIAKLMRFIKSKGIPCEYSPYGSFDNLELIIKYPQDISINTDSSMDFWVNNHQVVLESTQFPGSLAGVRIANMVDSSPTGYTPMLIIYFEPSYYRED